MLQRDLHDGVKKDSPDSFNATSKTKDLYKLKCWLVKNNQIASLKLHKRIKNKSQQMYIYMLFKNICFL